MLWAAIPQMPTGLVLAPLSEQSIRLSWQDQSNNETEFGILRQKNAGQWELIATTLVPNQQTWTDVNLASGAYYCYRVFAQNAEGRSEFSDMACAITGKQKEGTPILTQIALTAPTTTTISWTLNQPSLYRFRIQQRTLAGAWATLAQDLTTTTWNTANLEEQNTYCFRVQAYRIGLDSDFSAESCQTTRVHPPAAIKDLIFTPDTANPDRALKAVWLQGDQRSNVVFEVQYKRNTETVWPNPLVATTTSFILQGLTNLADYELRVRAKRIIGNQILYSDWSASVNARTWLAIWPGDTNGDGRVTVADLTVITLPEVYGKATVFSNTPPTETLRWQIYTLNPGNASLILLRADANRDGVINVYDVLTVVANWGQVASHAQEAQVGKIVSETHAETLRSLLNWMDGQPEMRAARLELSVLLKTWQPLEAFQSEPLPETIRLSPVFPNPMEGNAHVLLALSENGYVNLRLWNALGQPVRQLNLGQMPAGQHALPFSLHQEAQGLYFLQIEVNGKAFVKPFVYRVP